MPSDLAKRGSTYYFRRAVPEPLRPYFLTARGAPRTEFMESLGTKYLARAKELVKLRGVEVDQLYREARAKLKAGIPPVAPSTSGPHSQPSTAFSSWSPERQQRYREDEDRWIEENTAFWAKHDLEEEAQLENDPRRRETLDAVQAALARRDQQDREMQEAMAEEAKANRAPLMDMFDAYVAERNPGPATVKRWRPVMDHMKAFLGHDDARRITRANVVAWKDALLASELDAGRRG